MIMAERGLSFGHPPVHRRMVHVSPQLPECFRWRRQSLTFRCHPDATSIQLCGQGVDLYRGADSVVMQSISSSVNTVNCRLHDAFFEKHFCALPTRIASPSMTAREFTRQVSFDPESRLRDGTRGVQSLMPIIASEITAALKRSNHSRRELLPIGTSTVCGRCGQSGEG